ncbi:MAG: D-alanyl-D-alanine carboxypeptidase [Lachnospiraceae bacterium]|nr:D-alanyl-D-alanine carboxypeptidase [Lachnospiraceae bacterium]
MKCINKVILPLLIISILMMSGCSQKDNGYAMPFERNSNTSTISVSNSGSLYEYCEPFAKDLCVDESVYSKNVNLTSGYAAGLFDINNNTVIYGKNMYEVMTPASITKLLTALTCLKYYDMDDKLTFTSASEITEAGAQKIGFKEGDTITVEQALNILLLFSANDVAMMIANNYEGGYDEFIRLMNEEAKSLGATHTNFVNPHGLTEDTHGSTVYDLYLILNELVKDERFTNIVSQSGYVTSYTKADGTIKTIELNTTNMYLNGTKETPEGITIIGGKTGTTDAAGKCLILYFKDSDGNPYISCILRAEDHDILYEDMSTLIGAVK